MNSLRKYATARRSIFISALLLICLLTCNESDAQTFIVSNSDPSGSGSLAWAVNSVNALETTDNTISFDAKITHITIPNELTITKTTSIFGGGATIEGSGTSRLFTITNGHVQFSRLTFTGGYARSDNGGAVKVEGSSASAAFTNCTFFNNQADNNGGAVCLTNAALTPRTTFTHCTIAGNLAARGGGLAVITGRAEITASIITGNTVSYDLYSASNASVIADYNIIGSANIDTGTSNLTYAEIEDVFFTSSGTLALETVDGAKVLRLSGSSLARDFLEQSSGEDRDQTGALRPRLAGYDAGAFEARPVPVESVEISGIPYLQVNDTESLTLTIEPADASVNYVEWRSSSPSIISVDDDGNIRASGVGSSYITAAVHGWDASGQEVSSVASNALVIHAGTDVRRPIRATVKALDSVDMKCGTYSVVKPLVSLDINGINLANAKGGRDYRLEASPSRLDIVTTDIISGDSIRLFAGNVEGTCDITVRAYPLPDGDAGYTSFTVVVSDNGAEIIMVLDPAAAGAVLQCRGCHACWHCILTALLGGVNKCLRRL